MNPVSVAERSERQRNLLFLTTPTLWSTWPFLPLMRQRPGCEQEFGVLYDLFHVSGRTGFSNTVFLSNLFLMPRTESEILKLPRESFDTVEEVYAASWRVDGSM
ncbi:MAG TPA: hypothetical protein VGY58_12180 [Gemmataceae bacterium]|jgi:hypothetical protein|nr:hypothetical protein [Gemmataceae bacterium]